MVQRKKPKTKQGWPWHQRIRGFFRNQIQLYRIKRQNKRVNAKMAGIERWRKKQQISLPVLKQRFRIFLDSIASARTRGELEKAFLEANAANLPEPMKDLLETYFSARMDRISLEDAAGSPERRQLFARILKEFGS